MPIQTQQWPMKKNALSVKRKYPRSVQLVINLLLKSPEKRIVAPTAAKHCRKMIPKKTAKKTTTLKRRGMDQGSQSVRVVCAQCQAARSAMKSSSPSKCLTTPTMKRMKKTAINKRGQAIAKGAITTSNPAIDIETIPEGTDKLQLNGQHESKPMPI